MSQRQLNKIERLAVEVNASRKDYTRGAKRTLGREVTRGQRRQARLEATVGLQEIENDMEADSIQSFYDAREEDSRAILGDDFYDFDYNDLPGCGCSECQR